MSELKKDKKFWIGRTLLVVLFVFAAWLYYQLDENYRNLENTNQAVDDLVVKQTVLTKKYATEVIIAKKKVIEAEQRVVEAEKAVAQLRQDNVALRQDNTALQQKVKLLDKMAELEANIQDLKQKNTVLLNEIDQLEKESLAHPEKIKNLAEGKTMLTKFREKLRALDVRMHAIKRDAFQAKVQAQKDLDKKRSLAGNNGYLVRNGMVMPQEINLKTENANIKVDVKFVK
jgi:hypothetical protein